MKKNSNPIKSICVSQVATFDMHCANNGEKTFGNQPSIKKMPNGAVYISGQMLKRALIDSYRKNITLEKGEYLSEPDSTTNLDITNDVAADLRGFMDPDNNQKRISPIATQVARAINKNKVHETIMDLLTCFKRNSTNNSIVNREISVSDDILFNFSIDAERVGVTDDIFSISQEDKTFERNYISHLEEATRKKRIINTLKSMYYLNAFSNQGRNAVNGSPNKVIIVLDTIHSRKAFHFWEGSESVRQSILAELDDRGVVYFIGDDSKVVSKKSAYEAYKQALDYLTDQCEFSQIYSEIMPAIAYWEKYSNSLNQEKEEQKEKKASKKTEQQSVSISKSAKKAAEKKVLAKKTVKPTNQKKVLSKRKR